MIGGGATKWLANQIYLPMTSTLTQNTNPNWVIDDKLILNFELTANISGVLIHYKINNLLNAFGNDKIWIQNNHMYQKIGRMIQFGVTWNFTN